MKYKWNNSKECKSYFINLANNFWNNYKKYIPNVHNYNYDKTEINSYKSPIIVTCKLHGDFECSIKGFLGGHGCKECAKLNRNASHTLTKDELIKRGKEIFGDIYDYSKVDLNNKKDGKYVEIICPEHGSFFKNPIKFIHGQGCPICARKLSPYKKDYNHPIDTDICIKKLKEKFGNKYDYSLVSCKNCSDYITLICKIHGPFKIKVGSALTKSELCPTCSNNKEILFDDFLKQANKKFNNYYDYSKVEYYVIKYSGIKALKRNQNITIICPKHGEFTEEVNKHLSKGYHGCKKCKSTYSPSNDEFIKMCKEKWGNKYDYSKTKYVNKGNKIIVICPEHGEFKTNPYTHLNGKTGCPICSGNTLESGKYNRLYKLNILTEYDLLSMDWAVILDLIGEDKLPNEFKCLCKFGENTPERKKMIDDLKETYNIETTDEEEISEVENNIDDSIETEVNDINSEENIYNETDEDVELDTLKEIKDIGSLLNKDNEDIFSTGDKFVHIIHKQMNRIWNLVLRDNENHSTKNIEIIKSKLNDNITKFERYVYEEFLKEYEEVINLEIH